MGLFTKIFKNSRRFYALRIASRLIGLICAAISYFIYSPIWLYTFFLASIVADIVIFKVCKLKESAYKNPDLFKNEPTFSLEKFDAYTKAITNIRLITFIGATVLGSFIFGSDFTVVLIIAAPIYMACMFFIFIHIADKYSLPKAYVDTTPQTISERPGQGIAGWICGIYTGNFKDIGT